VASDEINNSWGLKVKRILSCHVSPPEWLREDYPIFSQPLLLRHMSYSLSLFLFFSFLHSSPLSFTHDTLSFLLLSFLSSFSFLLSSPPTYGHCNPLAVAPDPSPFPSLFFFFFARSSLTLPLPLLSLFFLYSLHHIRIEEDSIC